MRRTIAVAMAAALLAGAGAAAAQSFDCAKAAKPDEKAVCADTAQGRSLGNLDTKMATLWWVVEQVPMMMGARGAARDDQEAFLKTRAACGADTACLTNAYDTRIAALQAQVKDRMQQYCKAIQLC